MSDALQMHKIFMMLNIRSMNDLPVMERWLLRTHAPETVSRVGPWLSRYQSYRAVPPPPLMHTEAERFGYYNWRVTELWTRGDSLPQLGILPQEFFPNYPQILGLSTDLADAHTWRGRPEGPRQVVRCLVPARPTNDFLGDELPIFQHDSILRWSSAFKLPEGVSMEEAERWFLDVHAREVLEQPGLKRFVSWKVVPAEGRSWNWHRVSELWYEDFDAWHRAVIESPPRYTPPPWAHEGAYPFFKPYVDFASTFLLEAPTNCFLPAYGDYVVSV